MSKKIKFGFQGLNGAYHEIGAKDWWSKNFSVIKKNNKIKLGDVEFVSCDIFETIFEKVDSGELDYGIVAVENSLMGSIYKNFDLLFLHNLKVIGEVYVHAKHQLFALPSAKKKDILEIISQMPALLQCEHNIKKYYPNAKMTDYYDTSASAKLVKESGDKSKAAICSKPAGEINELKIIQKDFNDDPNNYTRFFVISKDYLKLTTPPLKGGEFKTKSDFKTSIIFYGGNVAGFLYKALGCFSLRDINLSKIESRPVPKSPWQYYFYLDFEGKYDDQKIINANNNLKEYASDVRILGSYKIRAISDIAHKKL